MEQTFIDSSSFCHLLFCVDTFLRGLPLDSANRSLANALCADSGHIAQFREKMYEIQLPVRRKILEKMVTW